MGRCENQYRFGQKEIPLEGTELPRRKLENEKRVLEKQGENYLSMSHMS